MYFGRLPLLKVKWGSGGRPLALVSRVTSSVLVPTEYFAGILAGTLKIDARGFSW